MPTRGCGWEFSPLDWTEIGRTFMYEHFLTQGVTKTPGQASVMPIALDTQDRAGHSS